MLVWFLLSILLIIVSVNDFLFFRIEDELVLSLCVLYGISCLFGISGGNFLYGFSIATSVFIITFILNQFDLIGGGDVKLLFPLILFAEKNLDAFLIGVSIAGILLSILYMVLGKYIFAFRRKIVLRLLAMKKNINKNQKKTCLLNLTLLSLYRITNRTANLTYRFTNVLKQEIPYGVALSCGEFYVMLENLLSR